MFKSHFSTLRFDPNMNFSTKMAAEVATNLTSGLLNPMYAQIDPIRLAEVDRSMRIAEQYGIRLQNNNLNDGALDKLLSDYPSHGFVIDRNETKKLFKSVEEPTKELREIADVLRLFKRQTDGLEEPFITFLSSDKQIQEQPSIESENADT